ncbi:MAG: hypothetical protein AAF738_11810, partial [Bacteroidota bacterium]
MRHFTGFVLLLILSFSACRTPEDSKSSETQATTDQITVAEKEKTITTTSEPSEPRSTKPIARSSFSEVTFSPRIQSFQFSPLRNQSFVTQKGTRFTIPANAFLLPDGSKATDSVTLRISEFYTKADFVRAKLSTETEGGLLESGGMFYMEVFSEGQALKLDKPLDISIPTKNTQTSSTEDMEVFVA